MNRIAILLLISIVASSCVPMYYNPVKQNVKVFEKKGDVIAAVSGQLVSLQLGVDAGYALTDNVGINTSYNRFNTSLYGGETNPFVKDFIWDSELVFYKNYKFGLFGAANIGYGLGGFNVCNPYYRLTMNRFYAQPSIGYLLPNHHLGIAFSTRFSESFYNSKTIVGGYTETENRLMRASFGLDDLRKSKSFVDPAITLIYQTNLGMWKFQYVYTTSSPETGNLFFTYSLNLKKLLRKKNAKSSVLGLCGNL